MFAEKTVTQNEAGERSQIAPFGQVAAIANIR
jgi:hypothetical protein